MRKNALKTAKKLFKDKRSSNSGGKCKSLIFKILRFIKRNSCLEITVPGHSEEIANPIEIRSLVLLCDCLSFSFQYCAILSCTSSVRARCGRPLSRGMRVCIILYTIYRLYRRPRSRSSPTDFLRNNIYYYRSHAKSYAAVRRRFTNSLFTARA